MVGNRLGQSGLLPHAFAVARNSPARCIAKLYPFERFVSEPGGLVLTHPVEHEVVEDKLPPGDSTGKGVELRAVADGAKELKGVAWGKPHHRNVSARWLNQPRHQVHQRCLPGSIRSDQGCDSGRNRQRNSVYSQNFAVKFGYILENDPIHHPRTTSRARMRANSIATKSKQANANIAVMAAVGKYAFAWNGSGTPSNRCQRTEIMNGKLSSNPHLVRKTALTMPPTPAGTRMAAKITPVATTLHFTQEERARPSRERKAIQMTAPATMPPAMGRWLRAQGWGEE